VVPVSYPANCILKSLRGVRSALEILDSGDLYRPEIVLRLGMVYLVLPLEQGMPESFDKATVLGEMPQEAFVIMNRSRLENVEAQTKERMEEKEKIIVDRWYRDDVREKLKIAMTKY
jgi:enoyl-CoA hydratase/carnithine racemase